MFINLKRFNYNFNENEHIKLNDLLIYEEVINLNKYVYDIRENRSEDNVYILYGVIVHSGSFYGGHYYIYIRDYKINKWICYNDKNVQIKESECVFNINFGGKFINLN